MKKETVKFLEDMEEELSNIPREENQLKFLLVNLIRQEARIADVLEQIWNNGIVAYRSA